MSWALRTMFLACLCKLLLGWPINPYMNHNFQQATYHPLPAHMQHQHQPTGAATLWPHQQAARFNLNLAVPQHRMTAIPISSLNSPMFTEKDFRDFMSSEEAFEIEREREQLKQQEGRDLQDRREREREEQLDGKGSNSNSNGKDSGNGNGDYGDNFHSESNEQMFGRNRFDDIKPNRVKLGEEGEDRKYFKDESKRMDSGKDKSQSDYAPAMLDEFEVRKSTPLSSKDAINSHASSTHKSSNLFSNMPADPNLPPVEVKRQTLASPNGQLTYITEMLYDANPFKNNVGANMPTTFPPTFLEPSTELMFNHPSTESSRMANLANPYGTYVPPLASSTMPMDSFQHWPAGVNFLPTPPPPFKSLHNGHRINHGGHNGLKSHVDRAANLSRKYVKAKVTHTKDDGGDKRGASSNMVGKKNSIVANSEPGLGAAAIAGIVIGSLVSVALLAGTTQS